MTPTERVQGSQLQRAAGVDEGDGFRDDRAAGGELGGNSRHRTVGYCQENDSRCLRFEAAH